MIINFIKSVYMYILLLLLLLLLYKEVLVPI